MLETVVLLECAHLKKYTVASNEMEKKKMKKRFSAYKLFGTSVRCIDSQDLGSWVYPEHKHQGE